MTQTPSSGASATPTTGSPATGNATGSATPPAATLTLEEALKQIAELKQHAQNKESEAAHHGKKLSAAEKELEAYKAAEEQARQAQMSELEKAQKAHADLQAQYDSVASELVKSYVRDAVDELAPKFNFILSAKGLTKLLLQDGDAIEWDDDTGEPTNIEKLLDKLAKAEPDLVKKEAQQQQQGVPNLPAFGISGRSSIQPPDGRTPGRIPRITDPGMWKSG